jgi:DNA-binding NarL/FixJ family response regulator
MKGRVLVIEDYGLLAENWANVLSHSLNVDVWVELEEHRALSMIRETDFDVIVTGYYFCEWPPDDGYNRIMSAARYRETNTPVIFMASRVSPKDAFEAAKLGAFDFLLLERDSDPSILVDSVKSALELRRIPKLFISYSSEDRQFAERIAQHLHDRGWQVWYDIWEIKIGDSIAQKIQDGLVSSSYLVVLLSEASVRSKWVKEEIDAAFVQQLEDESIKILPALIQECKLPPFLKSKRYADFRESFERGMAEIVKTVTA